MSDSLRFLCKCGIVFRLYVCKAAAVSVFLDQCLDLGFVDALCLVCFCGKDSADIFLGLFFCRFWLWCRIRCLCRGFLLF